MLKELNGNSFQENVLDVEGYSVVAFLKNDRRLCQETEKILEEIEAKYSDKACIYKVDVDKEVQLTKDYYVMDVPTIMYFESGAAIGRDIGYQTKEDIQSSIEIYCRD